MNRIDHHSGPSKEAAGTPKFDLESALFSPPTPDSLHALFAPLHYEPNYAYPLIVWLHGPGQCNERQLLRIMPSISMRNYVAIAPRGFYSGEVRSGGRCLGWPQTEDHICQTQRRVFEAIEAAEWKCTISKRRIFLAGFSSGGTMALRLAMNQPDRFAGVLSLCGAFPRGRSPLACLTAARQLPVFLVVGRDSAEYTPGDACEDLRLLHAAGVSVSLRQYPCGQQLSPQMLRDVDRWIIEQITSRSDPHAERDTLWSFLPE